MYLFWTLRGIGAFITLVFVYFFFVGLGDGTVSSFNGVLWLVILSGLLVVLAGGYWLFSHQYTVMANLLLGILAVPGLLYGLFMGLMLTSNNSGWK